MPIPFIFYVIENGAPPWLANNAWLIAKTVTTLAALYFIRSYAAGARNTSERDMHGKVVLMTGGTSGIGGHTAYELAKRGAQLILLTRNPLGEAYVADYVQDLRNRTGNNLIYAENVDFASLHSVRTFATKWINNTPPRRLDMIVLCGAAMTTPGNSMRTTADGIEESWQVNFLSNFHLLSILSPAIKVQPFDRDVRVVYATCSAYISSPNLTDGPLMLAKKDWTAAKAFAKSKLAMMTFLMAFQKHLDAYKRPDGLPMNSRVLVVDPGLARTPSMRRWLTRGSLWGLLLYILGYFFPWLLLKSPEESSQSLLYACMDQSLGGNMMGEAVREMRLVKECMPVDFARKDLNDEQVAKRVWEESDKLVEKIEKEQAQVRARAKKAEEEAKKAEEEKRKLEEIDDLVKAIKKGKKAEAQKEKAKQRKKGKTVSFMDANK
ncbi:hypothetical protein TD95_004800 [Thielaviopsis punctulata]|uniref:Ketoreductase (KR) domain-containing protein n=1 Tax=Thielaviopsis punctulata TaxID=72032 RepID=A0A0F4ZJ83_9PEZI|nr:hypothetical protein TD95_004800 [Thielaviopsis punctulata]